MIKLKINRSKDEKLQTTQKKQRSKFHELLINHNAKQEDIERYLYLEKCGFTLQFDSCFTVFEELILRQTKGPAEIEVLKRFLENVLYFKNIMPEMPHRLILKIIKELKYQKFYPRQIISREFTEQQNNFYIILKGEVFYNPLDQVPFKGEDSKYSKTNFKDIVKQMRFSKIFSEPIYKPKNQKTLSSDDTFGGQGENDNTTIENFNAIASTQVSLLILSAQAYHELLQEYHEQQIEKKVQFILSISLFSQISSNRLRQIIHLFREESYKKDSFLYQEGDLPEACWIVNKGEIELSNMIQIPILKQKQRVEMSIQINGCLFGEKEFVQDLEKRDHRAKAKVGSNCYKINYHDFFQFLREAHVMDQMIKEFEVKNKYWLQHQAQAIQFIVSSKSDDKKVKDEHEVFKKIYSSKVQIPKTYNNYVEAKKMVWNIKEENLQEELKRAHIERRKEIQELLNIQVKKQFYSTNYMMRRHLIDAYKRNIHIEVMNGLNLEKYAQTATYKPNNISQLFHKLHQYNQLTQQETDHLYKNNQIEFENQNLKFYKNTKTCTHSTQQSIHEKPQSRADSSSPITRTTGYRSQRTSTPFKIIKEYQENSEQRIKKNTINRIQSAVIQMSKNQQFTPENNQTQPQIQVVGKKLFQYRQRKSLSTPNVELYFQKLIK